MRCSGFSAWLALPALFVATACRSTAPRVRMETELGNVVVAVYPRKAPITAPNFLRYVDEGRYNGATFYRAVRVDNQTTSPIKIEVIQGGIDSTRGAQRLPAIAHETTAQTGLRHRDGTLSMARSQPGTAASEFFICINDQPQLDFGGQRNPDGQGFAAFGRVVRGMDVVRQIQQGKTRLTVTPQPLERPVVIRRMVRLR